MNPIHVEVSEIRDFPAQDIYAILVDYTAGHPAILPKPYFTGLAVEPGGVGAGTVARIGMQVLGVRRIFRQVVSEPEPGRARVETDPQAGVVTRFTVDPLSGGRQPRVTISTDSRSNPGIQGFLEKLINPLITRRIYREELQQLARYLHARRSPAAAEAPAPDQ